MKIKTVLVPVLILLMTATAYGMSDVGDITVEAEGSGGTKAEALLAAKREALSSGIGTILISETEVENYALKKDMILTRTIGAVRSYEVLGEKKEGGAFQARISAVVSLADIKEDLGALKILLESMDKPRMMVLVSEEKGNVAETVILDYLREKDFDLVDAAAVAALMQKDEALIRQATAGDAMAAAKLGAANGAEFVIVGQVVKSVAADDLLNSTGMISGQANISARVINCSNARIIASKTARGAAPHISAEAAREGASENAARNLMDRELFEKIVAAFRDMVNNGMTLEVTVSNVGDFRTQKAVQKFISGLEVSSVSKRAFGEGKLLLSVVFKGNADGFAEAVDGGEIMGRKMAVTAITASQVTVILR